ncbi:Putative antitoxin VapB5 [Actinomyces bovis]|uniref:Antitoxin n=1 Tax=Actinomyces bovis TaxID=1658 RepID=A0ABY1VQA3_9ACTO|nr:type II toxin-antitoxin system prevent-host-death family antitoxin [Actinomyces bovis]SPT53978.1 Putative antitoxin VapB5 [Actinomyces bovis]VEG53526.1 Putative antitoxin VapB5 [Actinomyces israelii]
MSTASISQRELRKDSSAVLRRVEEGEALRVTRQGVPVALLMPVVEDGGLR